MKWTANELTLEQKVGQMFTCGFNALVPNEHAQILIEQYQVGGICYFRRNVQALPQLAELSASLQEMATKQQKAPLFLSIDQEGGMVARIDHEALAGYQAIWHLARPVMSKMPTRSPRSEHVSFVRSE
ncbi:beta-hexosaminidase [Paenibacillus sp. JCM 10914]|nr:beta-hexosaminidase [Paenibacillus sp. JCM 10914]